MLKAFVSNLFASLLFLIFGLGIGTNLSYATPPSDNSNKDLVNLHAEQMGGEVLLELTFHEISKIDSFGVERSIDGKTFREVLHLNRQGRLETSYRLFDKIPSEKDHTEDIFLYYRVKISHQDGTTTYSDIGGLNIQQPEKWQVSYQADSTNTLLEVHFEAPQKERISIKATDGANRRIYERQIELDAGPNILLIDIASWPRQFYFLNFKSQAHFERHNFAKR